MPKKKRAAVLSGSKEVRVMYSDYGYIVDGVEYATIDEAYED